MSAPRFFMTCPWSAAKFGSVNNDKVVGHTSFCSRYQDMGTPGKPGCQNWGTKDLFNHLSHDHSPKSRGCEIDSEVAFESVKYAIIVAQIVATFFKRYYNKNRLVAENFKLDNISVVIKDANDGSTLVKDGDHELTLHVADEGTNDWIGVTKSLLVNLRQIYAGQSSKYTICGNGVSLVIFGAIEALETALELEFRTRRDLPDEVKRQLSVVSGVSTASAGSALWDALYDIHENPQGLVEEKIEIIK